MPDADVRAYQNLWSVELFGYELSISKRSPRLEARYYELAGENSDD